MIRIAVVAPILAVRAGLRALLSTASASSDDADAVLVIVYEAATLEDFEVSISQVDVLLITAEAAARPELERITVHESGSLALLLLSDDLQAAKSLVRLPLRAWGLLSMDASAEELLAAIRALHEGLFVGTATLMEYFLPHSTHAEPGETDMLITPLTERESQVLQLLARGLANKQIAASLGISEHTVKFHVSSIYTKLGATNRTEAVRTGVLQGLVIL